MNNVSIMYLVYLALSVGLTGAFLVLLAAQSEDDAIMGLRKQVADLGLRVSKLEHAGGKSSGGGVGDSLAGPVRSMILVSINKSDHSGDHAKERRFSARGRPNNRDALTRFKRKINRPKHPPLLPGF